MSFPRTRESGMPRALSEGVVYETTQANRIGRVASWILASARMTNVAVVSSRLLGKSIILSASIASRGLMASNHIALQQRPPRRDALPAEIRQVEREIAAVRDQFG